MAGTMARRQLEFTAEQALDHLGWNERLAANPEYRWDEAFLFPVVKGRAGEGGRDLGFFESVTALFDRRREHIKHLPRPSRDSERRLAPADYDS